jgi:type VI protein secretion system component VasA
MNALEVADPYVERLLGARVPGGAGASWKIDAEFPRFTRRSRLFYPHYLVFPTPRC